MYLLIIGSPRSGTTLFASMISAHEDVAMLIEDKFFSIRKLTGKKISANKLCIPHQIDLFKKANYFSRIAKKLGLMKNYPASPYTIIDYLNLPDSKILAIVRNGEDVISSIQRRGKKVKKIAVNRWEKAIEIIYELKRIHPDNMEVVVYDDLIKNPETSMKKVCKFLDIEFQDQMIEGGYKYNILYPGNNKIDSNKANRPDHDLDDKLFHRTVIEKYLDLKGKAI